MSDSVWPHRRQPIRLPGPWGSPGKNTGVGRHFLLQCMKVKSESEVAQSCPTPSHPMACSPAGSSVHGICQARVLEWVAIWAKAILRVIKLDLLQQIHQLFSLCSSLSQDIALKGWLIWSLVDIWVIFFFWLTPIMLASFIMQWLSECKESLQY